MIEQLRFIRLPVVEIEAALGFARGLIGLELSETDKGLARLRCDDKLYALEYNSSEPQAKPAVAFEVRTPKVLAEVRERLVSLGLRVEDIPPDLAQARRHRDSFAFEDFSGNRFEIVTRHQNKALRHFPTRDCGITGLSSVSLRSTHVARDAEIWAEVFGLSIRDYVGDAVYLGHDDHHHRLSLHPSDRPGIIQIAFDLEDLNNLMQNYYYLSSHQVRLLHGPGKLPCSGESFVTFEGPEGVGYRLVLQPEVPTWQSRPRQFSDAPASHCSWGSPSLIPELGGQEV